MRTVGVDCSTEYDIEDCDYDMTALFYRMYYSIIDLNQYTSSLAVF